MRSGTGAPVTPEQRCSLPAALSRVQATAGIDLRRATVRVGVGRGHLLDLVIKSGEFSVADDPAAIAACEQLAQLLLGETYRDWIGAIRTVPGPKVTSLRMAKQDTEQPFYALDTLAAMVDRGQAGIISGLSEQPYHRFCEHAEWTLLDVEPAAQGGVINAQDDLVLCSTFLPEMMKCFLQKEPFSSVRFSRHGEVFAYLKYQGGARGSEERLSERTLLEDAINRALVPGAVGCVVGGGLGVSYAYIDLALAELGHGISLVRQVFQREQPAALGWLLFCDSARSQDWVALSDAAPTPPGMQPSAATTRGVPC